MSPSIENLKTNYTEALSRFLRKNDEALLERAYEIGRQAILIDSSLLHVVTTHHELLAGFMTSYPQKNGAILKSAGAFLRETLAAFEMIQRGYGDTVSNLRQKTDELDETNKRLINLNENLEIRVAEKTATVEEKSRELARTNDELEQFVHAAAHDLKEPLRTITSYVQLLQKVSGSNLAPGANDYIQFVVDGTHRLQELIDDLLSYTRLNAGPQPSQMIDLSKVLQETLTGLEATIKDNHAVVTHDELPTLPANHAHMVLLFQNLISNALKFHAKDPPRVHISARREEGRWVFSIADNGIGIDEKYFGKLFVVFQRLNTRDEYPGTGIGLALCRKIVEQQHGKIWLESKVGKGTTFYFSLPLQEDKK